MLTYTHPLYFPQIVFTGTVYKDTRIYILDWTKKDEICLKKHTEWNTKYWPQQQLPFMPSLPQEIDTWIVNMKFAITNDYRKEICRNARQCLEEWNVKRSFDTSIREYCLQTAETHAFVAFYLLEDCAYDVINQCYYRQEHDDKFLIKHALAYKFWAHQTGRGCIRQNSKLDELEKYVCGDYFVLGAYENIRTKSNMASEFLDQINKLEKRLEKMSPSDTKEKIV